MSDATRCLNGDQVLADAACAMDIMRARITDLEQQHRRMLWLVVRALGGEVVVNDALLADYDERQAILTIFRDEADGETYVIASDLRGAGDEGEAG